MRRKPSWAALKKAADERILIIDGAMGTMIQQHKLGEDHYRGAALCGSFQGRQGQ